MRNRSSLALIVLALIAIGAAILATTRVGTPDTSSATPSEASDIRHTPSGDDRHRLVVIGDSISQGDSDGFDRGNIGGRSWVRYVDPEKFRFVGGSVKGGMTAESSLGLVRDDLRADVVVYGLGTNDIREGASPAAFISNIAKHHQRSRGSKGATVVITAVGPVRGVEAQAVRDWNSKITQEAKAHDFHVVDAWTPLRTDDFTWRSQDETFDGIHPTNAGAKKLGEALSEQLSRLTTKQAR